MTAIRVLLVDDHETVRHGLKVLLDAEADIEVVGEAADGRAALDRAHSLRPDIVVMDVSMPEMNGLAATRAIRDALPGIRVVALTRYGDPAYVKALLDAGATGYVLKQSPTIELLTAIRSVTKGRLRIDPAAQAAREEALIVRLDGRPRKPPTVSNREVEVLRMTALGHSNKEIATALDLSVKTVEVHKANAMRKLELRGRIDVIRYAVLQGWMDNP
jgi:two-component system response regulator NreC